jgi:hypothetical protein
MCLRFMFSLTTRLAAWLRLARREETWKTAEILLLRHQLAVPDMAPDPTKLRLRLDNVPARGAGWATQRGRGAPVWSNGDTAYPKSTPSMSAAGVMSGRRSMRNELPRPRREAMAGTSSAI